MKKYRCICTLCTMWNKRRRTIVIIRIFRHVLGDLCGLVLPSETKKQAFQKSHYSLLLLRHTGDLIRGVYSENIVAVKCVHSGSLLQFVQP